MKNFLIAFLVFLVWSFFGLWLYTWLDPAASQSNGDSKAVGVIDKDTLFPEDTPLKIEEYNDPDTTAIDSSQLIENDDDQIINSEIPKGLKAVTPSSDLIFLFEEGITITKNSSEILVTNAIKDFKYKLNTYSIEHPQEELHVEALYSALENIETPNLGFQRGKKIQELLVETGVSSKQIVIKPVIREIGFDEKDQFENGISFYFKPLDIERVNSIELELPENKTLYPKLENNDIFENDALREFLAEVKQAIAENPDLRVRIIGHTDNVGNANDNYRLGLKYSRQVKWYLVNKGRIDRTKINAVSEGESKSIASNKTDRGRFLNRRIEIIYSTKN